MDKQSFLEYVEDTIIPIFTGSYIAGEVESNSRDNEVALGPGGTVLIKPNKNDEYRLILKRNLAFKASEVSLLKAIISEIAKIDSLDIIDQSYISRIRMTAIEKAICESVTDIASDTLLNIIMILDSFSNRTYEGRRINFGIIINEVKESAHPSKNLHYSEMFDWSFFAVLSNGMQSCVEFDKNGFFLGHMALEKLRFRPTICPYDYTSFARYCDFGRIGIVLDNNGEILIFKDRNLVYAKKRGVWNSYCHDEIIALLSNRTSQSIKEIRKCLYFTALDVSFAGTGGCIVYLNKEYTEQALSHINVDDMLSEKHYEIKRLQLLETPKKKLSKGSDFVDFSMITHEEYIKKYNKVKTSCLMEAIAGRKFHELNRKLRQELASIDGATIIDWDGTIIACGAIVRIDAGSSGGGRLAAAKALGAYGVALKISQDGTMQAFMPNKKNNKEIKEIFSVG